MTIRLSFLTSVLLLGACAEKGTTDIIVEIHRNVPFVDGDTADDATFVAVQDGDGSFVEATGTNGVYRVRVASNRFGVAVGCFDSVGKFSDIEIVQRVIEEGTTYKTVCKPNADDQHLAVTVKNMPANNRMRLRASRSVANLSADGTGMLDVQPGANEVFGTLTDANRAVVKLFRISNIQVPATTTVSIDVAADGAAPEIHPLTVTPAVANAFLTSSVVRPTATVSLNTVAQLGNNPSYFTLPASLRQPDDLFRITVIGGSGSSSRVTKTPGALAFTLPAAFETPTPGLVKTPILHPVWTFTPTPPSLPIQSYVLDASNTFDFNVPQLRDWFVTMSSGWIAGGDQIRYEFPDFSAVPGFADLALADRERIDVTISRVESTDEDAVDGTESASSSSSAVLGEFCGDGVLQTVEMCEPGVNGESATCNSDCTPAKCGDGKVNAAAGEDCDPPDGTTCSATCKAL
jgi:hypothetical protein